jgi:hypothetical protein
VGKEYSLFTDEPCTVCLREQDKGSCSIITFTKSGEGRSIICPFKKVKKRYKTTQNKIHALILILIGLVPIWLDNDATAFVFLLIFAVPLFFAKENWIE